MSIAHDEQMFWDEAYNRAYGQLGSVKDAADVADEALRRRRTAGQTPINTKGLLSGVARGVGKDVSVSVLAGETLRRSTYRGKRK